MHTQRTVVILALGYLAAVASPSLAQEEGIVFDPQTGNYIITYQAPPKRGLHQTVFVPGNKIVPTVKSKFSAEGDGKIRYSYKIKSGQQSQQDISLFMLIASRVDDASLRAPDGWNGVIVPSLRNPGFLVSWSYLRHEKPDGIPPGGSLSWFGFNSPDLPGIGLVSLRGTAPILAFAGYGPSQEISDRLMEIRRSKDGVTRHAAIPGIPVPEPFDAGVVLSGLLRHLNKDLVPLNLIEPVFAAPLSRLLEAAIDAARRGNTVALRGHLKELRHRLKGFGEPYEEDPRAPGKEDDDGVPETEVGTRAWPHPIAKLAARVLDFNLKYIERRLKD